jgi:hypothetical protein
MRYLALAVPLALVGCATTGPGGSGITVETTSKNQAMAGASCVARNNSGSWNFVTPATIDTGGVNGDLQVVCNKAGYRTSEFIFRPMQSSGSSMGVGLAGGGGHVGGGLGISFPVGGMSGGSYPPRVTIEMSPL